MNHLNYTPPPTGQRFMQSNAFMRLIAGPVGSAKTTCCIMELFRRAAEQQPAPDGFRYTRMAIVRSTLKALRDTVLKDVMQWLGPVADYRVSESTIYIKCGDIRSEWLLIPLDNPEDQKRLLSLQLTMAWMSEAIEMETDLISPLAGRLGRYPGANIGGCTFFGLILDTNMPTTGSQWHKLMTEPAADTQIFIQPGGMSPEAENLEWLTQTPETLKLPVTSEVRKQQGRTYYERFIRNNSEAWCTRYVHALFGPDPSGSAVFGQSFKESVHVVDNLEAVSAHPIVVGLDFGRNPCAVICQLDHKGRLLILEEVIAEDIGLELQLDRNLRPALMQERYLGKTIVIVGDPAGNQRSTTYEETSFDVVKRAGFQAFPGPTNSIDARLRAVESFLLGMRDGGPAVLFDRDRCPKLIRAMAGGYRFARTRAGQLKPLPDKNEYSHVADALQYAATAAHGGLANMISAKLRPRMTRDPARRFSSSAWT